jgi:glycosyltransferase involved in cell wall biosynthesis
MVSGFAPSRFARNEGGSERYCFNLSKRLQSLGHELTIYTSKYPSNTPVYEAYDGVPIVRFRTWWFAMQINPMSFFWKALDRHLDDYDLVHVHSYIFFVANQVAMLRKFKRRFPFVLHLHGGLEYISPSLMGVKASAMKVFYDATVGPFTIRTADRVIACCETDRQRAIEKFGAEPDRVVTIPNCIDSTAFKESRRPNPVNVTYIGRLTELKGSHQLPQIVKTICRGHRDIRFTIVGGGALEDSLRRVLKNYPVNFLGRVPHEAIPNILANSSILILPSFLEGFPLVTLEAHASSIPVVCYDVGGCWESVVTGETGALVPVGDVKHFIGVLDWMIDDEGYRIKMGERGRRNVLEKYDWSVAVRRILEVYGTIASKHS